MLLVRDYPYCLKQEFPSWIWHWNRGFRRCCLVAVWWGRNGAAPVPSLWLQSLPICDISNCWDESSKEISLQWVDWGWQLYVSLLSWMRRLQREIQMIYCTLSQTILTLKGKKNKKAQQVYVSLLSEDSILMKWTDSTRFLTCLLCVCICCDRRTFGWSVYCIKDMTSSMF